MNVNIYLYLCVYVYLCRCKNCGFIYILFMHVYFLPICLCYCMYICVHTQSPEKRCVYSCGNVTYMLCPAHSYLESSVMFMKQKSEVLLLESNILDTCIFWIIAHFSDTMCFYTCLHAFGKVYFDYFGVTEPIHTCKTFCIVFICYYWNFESIHFIPITGISLQSPSPSLMN